MGEDQEKKFLTLSVHDLLFGECFSPPCSSDASN
jgi:hypothetical protein